MLVLGVIAIAIAFLCSLGEHHFVTTDSCAYLSNALNLNHGLGYTTDVARWDSASDHQLIPFWPPALPLCVAALNRLGIPVEESGLLVSAIFFGLLVGATGLTAGRITGRRGTAVFAAMSCLVFWPIFAQSIIVMTEMPFTAFSMVALYCCLRAAEGGHSRWFIWAALFVAATTMTRYIGVAEWAVFAGWCVWLVWRGVAPRSALAWPVLAALPLAVWLVRNHLIYGGLTGHTVPPSIGLGHNLLEAIRFCVADFLPIPHLNTGLGLYAKYALAAVAVAVAFVLGLVCRRASNRVIWTGSAKGTVLVAVYAVAYLGTLAALAAVRDFDPINTRLTMPAYPAIIIVFAIAVVSLAEIAKVAKCIMIALASAWLVLATAASLRGAIYYTSGPWTSGRIRTEPSATLLRQMNAPRMASDHPARVWYITRRPARYLPDPADEPEMNSILEKHGLILVLFKDLDWRSPTIAGEAALRSAGILPHLELVSDKPDCDVYRVP